MSERGGATVSYFGVNEAYQLALAAQEAGLLDAFYCSLYDAPGKWGGRLAALLGRETLANRRCAGFNPADAIEIPWPFIGERVKSLFRSPGNEPAWFKTSDAFDRRVAKRLASSGSRVLVATEMCALQSFRVARDKGMKRVLDCPQVHMDFLNRVLSDAATDLGLSRSRQSDSDDVLSRKAKEYEMADKILVFSDVHRRSFFEAGFSAERIVQIPLWVDAQMWFPPQTPRDRNATGPLRVLFVGSLDLRKGVPYLLRAVEDCGGQTQLTLAGADGGTLEEFFNRSTANVKRAGRKNKSELRELYWQSDVLVLPSLVDSFGFVALEAMACGLPVIVTANCGAPVPSPDWRVPVMNSNAIASRLEHYAGDRDALSRDGLTASSFARHFTPERYRAGIREVLAELL